MNGVLNTQKDDNNNEQITSVLNTVRIVKSFSVTKEYAPILSAFIEISRREDPDFSTTVRKALKEYVQRHSFPNPQARLDRLLEIEMPHKPAWQCCVPECHNEARFQLILKDFNSKTEVFRVCCTHQKWKHKRFRFLVGFKDLKDIL